MKIYTKTGDKGNTSLIGGTRVSKSDLRIDSYGTIDELNSWIGLIIEFIPNKRKNELILIQNLLFSVGAQLASKNNDTIKSFKKIDKNNITSLEKLIDDYESFLPKMTHFILPGGSIPSANTHVARCVCRRAERIIVQLNKEDYVDKEILIYLNRLSDYLFCLARAFTYWDKRKEKKWIPDD